MLTMMDRSEFSCYVFVLPFVSVYTNRGNDNMVSKRNTSINAPWRIVMIFVLCKYVVG